MESLTNSKLNEIKEMLIKQDTKINILTDLIKQSTNETNGMPLSNNADLLPLLKEIKPLPELNDPKSLHMEYDTVPLSNEPNPFTASNDAVHVSNDTNPFLMEDAVSKKKREEEKNGEKSLSGGHRQQFYGLLSRRT